MAAAKRKKAVKGSEWSWRLAGCALCAFFALGVATGLSGGGHQLALRVTALIHLTPRVPAPVAENAPAPITGNLTGSATAQAARAALALVERGDGFYALDAAGGLRGPVSPAAENDMPILSGAAVANASAARLLDYASILVRAEASLGRAISELRSEADDDGVLYLDRPPLSIAIDFAHAPVELERANRVLALWRGHRDLLVALDMTVPGQAVVRLRPAALRTAARAPAGMGHGGRNPGPEVTASR
ncbi:MAG: hypothetical protein ACLQBA_03500 [Candidatus Binataceae bacterium]